MTEQRALKQRVRTRMERTGESYVTARRAVVDRGEADVDVEVMPTDELDAQLDRYVELGYPAHAELTEAAFRSIGAAAIERARTAGASGAALLVVRSALVAPAAGLSTLEVRGKRGYVDMDPSEPGAFRTIEAVNEPEGGMYVMQGFDPGDELRNLPPSEAMVRIVAAGRQPVTIDEGIAAVVLHPELLRDKHCFSILASRSDAPKVTKSVPALWISRGAPRLGWCWNGNPHTWLGSASCAGRA